MAFYGSIFTNETAWDRTPKGHARHIACPQRLKYIHDIKDGYIPYVEDSSYLGQTSSRYLSPQTNRLGLYNTADAWRQELMGLAQQVQSSFVPVQSSRSNQQQQQQRSQRSSSSVISALEDNDEQNISKRLLNRRTTGRPPPLYTFRPRIAINDNESEVSTSGGKTEDAGIWLLPILCHILQVDNIAEAQEWLVRANPTEKRLAMELISRTMHDLQNREYDYSSELSFADQKSASCNYNNLYWPYKFWQYQRQSRVPIDNTDTCERATSPVRLLTPAKRLSVSSISSRSETRLSRPTTTAFSDVNERPSRRGYRVVTSRNSCDLNSYSAQSRGKTPLI